MIRMTLRQRTRPTAFVTLPVSRQPRWNRCHRAPALVLRLMWPSSASRGDALQRQPLHLRLRLQNPLNQPPSLRKLLKLRAQHLQNPPPLQPLLRQILSRSRQRRRVWSRC